MSKYVRFLYPAPNEIGSFSIQLSRISDIVDNGNGIAIINIDGKRTEFRPIEKSTSTIMQEIKNFARAREFSVTTNNSLIIRVEYPVK